MLDQYICLKNYDEFIRIFDGNRAYYGGNQEWFKDKKNKKYGCAAVVASNITSYLSKNETMKNLYLYSDFSIHSFTKHMEEIVKYLKPVDKIGILKVEEFINGVEMFSKSRGVTLIGKKILLENGYYNFCDFIKEGLKNDNPIGMLILRNDFIKEFEYHWVTITKIYENEFDVYISISSWGEKRLLKLKEIYNYSSYVALVYFTKC